MITELSGRELDTAIAVALGWTCIKLDAPPGYAMECDKAWIDGHGVPRLVVSPFSTDGNAMLELIREMTQRGFEWDFWTYGDSGSGIIAALFTEQVKADTLPLAVARAALAALTCKPSPEDYR